MNVEWLIEKSVTVDGQTVLYSYDKEADLLEVVFQKGGGIGVDLTDNIVLRYNQDSLHPLSLIFTDVAILKRPTEFGPPSFQLTHLTRLPPSIQQTVLQILQTSPVNQFLQLSGLFQSGTTLQPITYLNQPTTTMLHQL